jgi:single-stranded-DNA-specific exonuclease
MVDEKDLLNPLDLDNIEEGAKLLAKHIAANSKVHIIIDADNDGYASAALFLNYFNRHFPSWV